MVIGKRGGGPPLKAEAESSPGMLNKFCTCHQGETEARLTFLPGQGDGGSIRQLITRPLGTPHPWSKWRQGPCGPTASQR